MRKFVLGLVIVACTGCGVTGGGGTPRAEQAAALAAALESENVSTPGALPASGTAKYAGFVTLALPVGGATSDHIGDLALDVNFAATQNQLSGTVTNLEGLTGALTIGGGRVDRTTDPDVDFTFDSNIAGTLAQGGDSYALDGSLVGEFRGRNQDGVTGLIYGDIDGPAGQDLFDGTLAGTRTN